MTARLLCMPMVSMIGRDAHSAKISQLRWMRRSSSEAVPASCSSTGVYPAAWTSPNIFEGVRRCGSKRTKPVSVARLTMAVDMAGCSSSFFSRVLTQEAQCRPRTPKVISPDASPIVSVCSMLNGVFLYRVMCPQRLKSPAMKCPQVIFIAAAIGSASRMPQNPSSSPRAMTMMMVTSGLRSMDFLKTSGLTMYPSRK